jgi:hypothetical protein
MVAAKTEMNFAVTGLWCSMPSPLSPNTSGLSNTSQL